MNHYIVMKKLFTYIAALICATSIWADDKTIYGVLNGEFSVSETKKVHFSKGNLQAYYNSSSTWEWIFTTNQYDYVGTTDGNVIINGNGTLSSTDHAVDLFGWSTPSTVYGIYNSEDKSKYSGFFRDWGANAISNGGNKADCWYAMSDTQWDYLLNTRATTTSSMPTGTNSANARYIKAQVASINGLILFPDGYDHPDNASVSVNSAKYNTTNIGYSTFIVDANNWKKMEDAGAVFLPAAGFRHGTDVVTPGTYGAYWTSTYPSETGMGYSFDFDGSNILNSQFSSKRSTGCAVRLVLDYTTITYYANGGYGSHYSQPKYKGLDRTLDDGTEFHRDGYYVGGWATTQDGDIVYPIGSTYTADADIALYAKWLPIIPGSGTEADPFTISSVADWNAFRANIDAGANTDKYFKLTSDIEVSTMVGNATHSFDGTFDGNDKKITVDINLTEEKIGLFRYVGGNARIHDLYVDGSVTTTQVEAGGLISQINAGSNVSLDSCRVSVEMYTNAYDEPTYIGGLVGSVGNNATLTITDCLFDGILWAPGSGAGDFGGFVGWALNKVNIYNSLFNPSTFKLATSYTFANMSNDNNLTIFHSYYTMSLGTAQGTQVYTEAKTNELNKKLTLFGGTYYGVCAVSGIEPSYIYNGSAIEPEPTVTFDGDVLTKDADYTVAYANNINVGTATVSITGMPESCANAKSVNFIIAGTPTGIEETNANANAKAAKILRNGQLYILRDGKKYNIIGVEIR